MSRIFLAKVSVIVGIGGLCLLLALLVPSINALLWAPIMAAIILLLICLAAWGIVELMGW